MSSGTSTFTAMLHTQLVVLLLLLLLPLRLLLAFILPRLRKRKEQHRIIFTSVGVNVRNIYVKYEIVMKCEIFVYSKYGKIVFSWFRLICTREVN